MVRREWIDMTQAACNQFHSPRQRRCRWLLMTHDQMQSDEFLLTREFLAMILGVQRTGASAAAGALQRADLTESNFRTDTDEHTTIVSPVVPLCHR